MKQMLHGFSNRSIRRRRDLRLMLPASAVSAFGDEMALIALTLRVYADGRDPWSISALLLCAAAPIALLAPLAGRLVDALPFRRLAIAAAGWQAGCCVVLALATPLWSTYLLVLALQAGQVVAGPAWQALLPTVAGEETGRALGASQALNTLARVAAPAAAGIAVGTVGAEAPLLVDALTFLALAAAAGTIRASRGGAAPETGAEAVVAGRDFSLRGDRLLWPWIVGLCVLVVAGQTTNVVEVFLVRGPLGAGPTAYGLVAALLAAALVAGSMLAGRPATDGVRARRTLAAALALAVALVVGGLAPSLWIFAPAWAFLGVANGIVNTDAGTLVLNRTPERCRGRVLAHVNGLVNSASLVALSLGGLAGNVLGPRLTFVVAGALLVATAAVLLGRARNVRFAAATVS
jgi:MFS family permease